VGICFLRRVGGKMGLPPVTNMVFQQSHTTLRVGKAPSGGCVVVETFTMLPLYCLLEQLLQTLFRQKQRRTDVLSIANWKFEMKLVPRRRFNNVSLDPPVIPLQFACLYSWGWFGHIIKLLQLLCIA
jgi:hypothetical protein